MPFDFPAAPSIDGLTFLNVQPALFADHRTARHDVFPVYYYCEDATGELILVAEDRYEEVLDTLVAMGTFGPKGGRT